MNRAICSVIFILWSSLAGISQSGFDITDHIDDTTRIASVWDTWSLRVFGARKAYAFRIKDRDTDEQISYRPNNPFSVGVGITYKWIALDLGINVGQEENKTRRFDVNATFGFDKNIFAVGFQRYQGYEIDYGRSDIDTFREDIRSFLMSLNYYRSEPSRRLSIKALTSGMQVQQKSTGVFMYGAYWLWDLMRADSSIIPIPVEEQFSPMAQVTQTSQFALGVSAGYAYSLVLPWNCFIFGLASPGVGLNIGRLQTETSEDRPPIFPATRIDLRAALGHAGPRVYVIFSANADFHIVPWGDRTQYSYATSRFKLSVGYRFRSKIGFLEKAADSLKSAVPGQ